MDKRSFVVYFEWKNALSCLNNEDFGALFRALFEFAESGIEPEIENSALLPVFNIMKGTVERDKRKYEARCEKNRANGFKGGRPKKPNETEENPLKPNGFLENPPKPKKADNDNDNDNVNDNDINNIYMSDSDESDSQRYSSEFLIFWNKYPKKVGKGAAYKAWNKAKLTKAEQADIIKALEWQIKSDQWQKESGQYIPHPSTYLSQRRWEDEPNELTADLTDPNRYTADFDPAVFDFFEKQSV